MGAGIEIEDAVSAISPEEFAKSLERIDIISWDKKYEPIGYAVLDGESWDVKYKEVDGKVVKRSGENAFPKNWRKFLMLLKSVTHELAGIY